MVAICGCVKFALAIAGETMPLKIGADNTRLVFLANLGGIRIGDRK
jgi:hypothetical protein